MREEFELQGQSLNQRDAGSRDGACAGEMWSRVGSSSTASTTTCHRARWSPPCRADPIYIGGHTDARCVERPSGRWVDRQRVPLDEAAAYIAKLKGYLHEYGRDDDPFEIVCGLYAIPTPELFKRAEEELGLTATLCMPWALDQDVYKGDRSGLTRSAEVFRPSIEQFATDVVSCC